MNCNAFCPSNTGLKVRRHAKKLTLSTLHVAMLILCACRSGYYMVVSLGVPQGGRLTCLNIFSVRNTRWAAQYFPVPCTSARHYSITASHSSSYLQGVRDTSLQGRDDTHGKLLLRYHCRLPDTSLRAPRTCSTQGILPCPCITTPLNPPRHAQTLKRLTKQHAEQHRVQLTS